MNMTMEHPTETVAAPPPAAPVVSMSRVIRAPRARVYEAWTSGAIMKTWFGGHGSACTTADLDVRVGGAYRIHVRPVANPASPGSTAEGKFTQVVPAELLQFNWVASWQPGEDSLVTVSFRDAQDGATELSLRHERFLPGSTVVENYVKGWTGSLDKLASHLEGAK